MKKSRKFNYNKIPGGTYIIPTRNLPGLSHTAQHILFYIISLHSNFKEVRVSNSQLVELTDTSVSTVQRTKKKLVQAELLKITHNPGSGNRDLFEVNEEKVNELLGFDFFGEEEKEVREPQFTHQGTYDTRGVSGYE